MEKKGFDIVGFLNEKIRDSDDIRDWMGSPHDDELLGYLLRAERKKIQAIGIGLGEKDVYRLEKQYTEGKQLEQGDPKKALRQGIEEFASRYFDPLTPREVGGILNEVGESMIDVDKAFGE